MVDAAGTAGVFQLLIRDALFVVDKIVAHCAFKQPGVLQNHAEQIVDASRFMSLVAAPSILIEPLFIS